MRTKFLAGAVVIALLACVQLADACNGELPESVVDCYSSAYAEHDIDALEALFADDYVWVDVVPPGAQVFDRSMALESARKMLAHPETSSVGLTLGGTIEVVLDKASQTWRIEGIETSLTIVFGDGADPYTVQTCTTLYVREGAEGSGTFEIFREVSFGNGDCAEWGARPN